MINKKINIGIFILATFLLTGCLQKPDITFNKTSVTLMVGEECQLDYELKNVDDENEVIFISSNESVVTVTDDKIFAVASGTAEITVKIGDKLKKAKVNVTVVDILIEVPTSKMELVINESKEIPFEVKAMPEGSKTLITSSDEEIIEISNKQVRAKKAGTANISIGIEGYDYQKLIAVTVLTPDIILKQSEYTLLVDEEVEVEYDVINMPLDAQMELTSDNETIVSINDGKIKAVAIGETFLTLKIIGTNYSKKIPVNITDEWELEILTSIASLRALDNLTLELLTSVDEEINFTSSDESVATISSSGKIEALKAGDVIFKVEYKNRPEIYDEISVNVYVDPMYVMSLLNVDKPLIQYVSTYGYNPDVRYQWVYGSVSRYFNTTLNIIESFATVNNNIYTGQKATRAMLEVAEPLKLVRSGILLEEINYITYHDTGNHTPGANAYANLNYMKSAANAGDRARSWHYTVDENYVYYGVPDNEVTWQGDDYLAYAQSIGVETCVDFGSDLYATWQRTAKLMAMLMEKYNLNINDIKQHYDWNGKNCPQTLRRNNLYEEAIELVKAEYLVRTLLNDYTISFKSLNKEYVDDRGKVIALPNAPKRVAYEITITGQNYQEKEIFYSVLAPTTGGNVSGELVDLERANSFDQAVLTIPNIVSLEDRETIINLVEEFDQLPADIKALIVSDEILDDKLYQLMQLMKVNTPIIITEVLGNTAGNSGYKYGYIELYNPTNQDISLYGLFLLVDIGKPLSSQNEGVYWYQFLENAIIKANSYFLIQGSISQAGTLYGPIPDVATNLEISSNSGTVALVNRLEIPTDGESNIIIDCLGYGNVSIFESRTSLLSPDSVALARRYLIDTNDNKLDYINKVADPINSFGEKTLGNLTTSQIKVVEVDLLIKYLASKSLTIEDQANYDLMVEKYNLLTAEERDLLACKTLYNDIVLVFEAVLDPSMGVINDVLRQIPSQIVNDFDFTQFAPAVTFAYKAGEDTTCFDLATGKILKTTYAAKYVTLIALADDTEKEFSINFGILESGQTTVFYSGATKPAAGDTNLGHATYEMQRSATGFGGIAIIVNNRAYFIANKCYISLSAPESGNSLTKAVLRPYGYGANDINNCGIVNGVATSYAGAGVLYQNTSDIALSFDASDTYGRNNASYVGYSKVIFRQNASGKYCVAEIIGDTGSDTTTTGKIITLQPGDFLWCPHSYEVNQSGGYGTYFVAPGSSTVRAVLVENAELNIIFYKHIQ